MFFNKITCLRGKKKAFKKYQPQEKFIFQKLVMNLAYSRRINSCRVIASLRSHINRALNVCSNQKLFKEELKIIEKIGKNNGYNKEIVQKINKKRIKTLNKIQSGQKPKRE